MSIAVGIDLGSTFSVVSYVKTDGSVEVIPNSEGNRITPSVFAIDDYGQSKKSCQVSEKKNV